MSGYGKIFVNYIFITEVRMSDKLFGTDGVRGKANIFPMTADFALKLGKALGTMFSGKVAIAKDTRVSCDMLESSLAAGLTSMGCDVMILGVLPTPVAAMVTPGLNVAMTIMISASHNPYFDNGIKLIKADGHKFSDDMTAKLEASVQADEFVPNPDKIGRIEYNPKAITPYLSKIAAIKRNSFPLSGLKVVIDCANGAFSKIAPQVFKDFGADVTAIGVSPDGYNINKDCGSTHTELMSKTVIEENADIGIALDGDGDRIIVCDDKGNRLDGDQIIAFLGQYLKQDGRLKGNAVVATIWSNMGLEKFCHSLGIDFYRTAVGERYVTEKMHEIGSNFGGEESGHMVLSDFAPTGDGLIAGLTVCLGLLKTRKKMSHVFPVFEKCPCKIDNLRFATREKVAEVMNNPLVQSAIEAAKNEISGKGSVIVRKSGTEPLIKVRVEAEDEALVQKTSAGIYDALAKFM